MNFSSMLNPTGAGQPAQGQPNGDPSAAAADPVASSSRMSFAFLDSPDSRPMTPVFSQAGPIPSAGPYNVAPPNAFQLHPSAQHYQHFMPPPLQQQAYHFNPYGGFDPRLLGVQPQMLVNPAALMQPPPPPMQMESDANGVIADSDDESARSLYAQGSTSNAVKQEDEVEVDIMGAGNEVVAVNALKAQARASPAPKPRAKNSQAKGKSRSAQLASSAAGSPAPSPGPSSLANEVVPGSSPAPSTVVEEEPPAAPEAPDYSFLPDIAPSDYHHPRLDPSVPRPRLPAAFETYVPPRRSRFGPGQDDSSSSDEDGEDAKRREEKRKAQAAAARERRLRAAKSKGGGPEEEEDDRLYCICHTLYNPERIMIACDRCEEWYHLDCVQIPEESVELVDLFICPKCASNSLEKTTWKSRCKRPTCQHPAAPLSKYCSDYCGISVAATRLSLYEVDAEVAPVMFWDKVKAATRREGEVVEVGSDSEPAARQAKSFARQDAADARLRSRIESRLAESNHRRAGLEAAVRLVEYRLAYLRIAIRRWEALCQATADEMASAGIDLEEAAGQNAKNAGGGGGGGGRKNRGKRSGASKKKGPVAATSLPDAQCGFDVRLVFDNKDWQATVDSPGVQAMLAAQRDGDDSRLLELALGHLDGVCLETKKRCDRHTGWQKIREADFAVEKAVLDRRIDRVGVLVESLSARLEQHDTTVAFRLANRARICDPAKLIDVEDFMIDREEELEDEREERESRAERSPSLHVNGTETPKASRSAAGGGGGGGGGANKGSSRAAPATARAPAQGRTPTAAAARSRATSTSQESTPAPAPAAAPPFRSMYDELPDFVKACCSRAAAARLKATPATGQ